MNAGNMIRAEPSNNYNRDVVAIPGEITGLNSKGSNRLIMQTNAALPGSANELRDMMNWLSLPEKKKKIIH